MANKNLITHEGFFSGGYMGATRPILKIQPLRSLANLESNTGKRTNAQDYSQFTPLALRLASCREGVLLRSEELVASGRPSSFGSSYAFLELEGGTNMGEWCIFQGLLFPRSLQLPRHHPYIATMHSEEQNILRIHNRTGNVQSTLSLHDVSPQGTLQAFKARHYGEKYQKIVDLLPLWERQVNNKLEQKNNSVEPNILIHVSDYLDEKYTSMYVLTGNYQFS